MSIQKANLTAIADAIREKDGSTGKIVAADFPARIRAIKQGVDQAILAGGTAGQVLTKKTDADLDVQWKALTAADVGARPDTWTPTAADVGAPTVAEMNAAIAEATPEADVGVESFNGRKGAVVPASGDYTAAQVGAVPTTRKVNGKALSADIILTASDVSAVPTTRTVNGRALSSSVTLTATDVNALPITGGTLTGDLRIKGSGNYGTKINLGDGDYVHISEPTDDNMEIKAKKIKLVTTANSSGIDIDDLKTSVSDGKAAIASAITDKGISTSSTATFSTMATNIRNIQTGITLPIVLQQAIGTFTFKSDNIKTITCTLNKTIPTDCTIVGFEYRIGKRNEDLINSAEIDVDKLLYYCRLNILSLYASSGVQSYTYYNKESYGDHKISIGVSGFRIIDDSNAVTLTLSGTTATLSTTKFTFAASETAAQLFVYYI